MTIAVFAAVRRDMQEGGHVPGSLAAYRLADRQELSWIGEWIGGWRYFQRERLYETDIKANREP